MVYFRFLSAQKLTTPMTQATATAASMAISVVMNGASVGSVGSGSVGSGVVGSGVVGSGVVGSGSIDCVGDNGSFTFMYVDADDLE